VWRYGRGLFVRLQHCGCNLQRPLLAQMMDVARQAGYYAIRLDTLACFTQARELMKTQGWQPIPPYNFNPRLDSDVGGAVLPDKQIAHEAVPSPWTTGSIWPVSKSQEQAQRFRRPDFSGASAAICAVWLHRVRLLLHLCMSAGCLIEKSVLNLTKIALRCRKIGLMGPHRDPLPHKIEARARSI